MSLLSSLVNSASALKTYDQVLNVTQNNVVNASTPGYVRQRMTLEALPFDPATGSGGGVTASDIQSARNEFDEQAVRQQTATLGAATQTVDSLTSLQSYFDVTGASGIPSALNTLFQAFSAWGQTPTDANAKQAVLNDAAAVASAFQDTASGLAQVTQNANIQIRQTVTQINQIAGQLAQYNSQIMAGDRNDAGLDAQVHNTLEQLSQYVNFTASRQSDGSYTVLLDGQDPLVIEDKTYAIASSLEPPTDPAPLNPTGPPMARIRTADGADITTGITSGQLGALLDVRNSMLPSYIGDAYQPGSLNSLAKQFADRVNQLLSQGTSTDGGVSSGGSTLFTYDAANPTNTAQTLAVDPNAAASGLVAADPATGVANGIPLALAALANPTGASDMINGASYTQYFGDMAARVGAALQAATNQQSVQQSAVAQAQNLRQQDSGVNLDEEAMTLVQFQTAYEANSRLISVLNQLTQDIVSILGSTA